MNGVLVVMTKAPRAGAVKTRLARGVGYGRATQLYRRLLKLTLDEVKGGPWRLVVAVDRVDLAPRRLLANADIVMPQGDGDLGMRMSRILKRFRSCPTVFIGADLPQLRYGDVNAAFAALKREDAVIGPALDGGYWLIGLAQRRRAPHLFEKVAWSTERAMADTLASMPPDFTVTRLRMLRDIDDVSDLDALAMRDFCRSFKRLDAPQYNS